VAVNSIASLGWKSIEMPEKMGLLTVTPEDDNLLSQYCTSNSTFLCKCSYRIGKKYWWFDWFIMIAVAASFTQNFMLQKWVFIRQEQKNDFRKFLTP